MRKMNKILSLATALAFAFGLASCSKDADTGTSAANDGDAVLTFALKLPAGAYVQSRAIAEGAEWTINAVDVYTFDNSGNFIGKLTENTDFEYETKTSGTTQETNLTTIKVLTSWLADYAGQSVNFYFVGNGTAQTALSGFTTGNLTAFEKLLTNELATDGGGKAALLATPLLFSANSKVTLKGKNEIPVQMKRREARFDIVNKYPNELEVKSVTVLNAKRAGYIFANGTGATFNHADLQEIKAPGNIAWNTFTWDVADDIITDACIAKSAFYLYPTTLGTDATAGETEIVIEATMGDYTAAYVMDEASEKNIVANMRYKLILDPLSLKYFVSPADYGDGSSIDTEAGADDDFTSNGNSFAIGTSGITGTVTDKWNAATQVYKFDANDADELSIVVESKYGTSYSTTYEMGDEANITNYAVDVTRAMTYGYKVTDTYTVKVPKTASTETFNIKLRIFSPGGKAEEVITFTKGIMTLENIKDIVSGNDKLAEAIKDAIIKKTGKTEAEIRPEDLDAIETLDVSGADGPASLDGIENLTNLKELNAAGNTNLTGSVDLSGNPELVNVNLNETNIESIDISNNPNLEELRLHNTNISEINFDSKSLKVLAANNMDISSVDVSKLPSLEVFAMGNNKAITALDFSGNTNLREIHMTSCSNLESVNISNNIELTNLSFSNCGLKTLNVSNNKEIQILNLNKIKVTSLDLTGLTKLTQVVTTEAGSIANLILGNHPSLVTLHTSYTALSSINVTSCPALTSLRCGATNITTLDISNCRVLDELHIQELGDLTVEIWDGYNTSSYKIHKVGTNPEWVVK